MVYWIFAQYVRTFRPKERGFKQKSGPGVNKFPFLLRSIKHLHFLIFVQFGFIFWDFFAINHTLLDTLNLGTFFFCQIVINEKNLPKCEIVWNFSYYGGGAIFFYGHCDFLHLEWTATRWILERSNSTTFC